MISPVEQEWVDKLKKHALENYDEGGWDYLVECYTDQEIVDDFMKGTTTYSELFKEAEYAMKTKDSYRRDIQLA
jgi:hypothetical protein